MGIAVVLLMPLVHLTIHNNSYSMNLMFDQKAVEVGMILERLVLPMIRSSKIANLEFDRMMVAIEEHLELLAHLMIRNMCYLRTLMFVRKVVEVVLLLEHAAHSNTHSNNYWKNSD